MHIYEYDGLGVLFGPITLPEIPGLGSPLPSNCIETEELLPKADDGKVWAVVDAVPVQLIDRRGTVYSVTTGAEEQWLGLGEVPAEYTLIPFPGIYHVWSGTEWVLDAVAAAQAERSRLLDKANQATVGMVDAYIAGLLDEEDTKTFKAFAAYKLALSKIAQQPGYPTTIEWPTYP